MSQVNLYRSLELPWPTRSATAPALLAALNTSINAANAQLHFIGYVVLENPTGGSKTISSAGGKIHWRSGANTVFANAATSLQIGIQDVSTTTAPAQGDGTFDVSATLVGGTDTITADAYQINAMEAGSKTLAHGQLVSIAFKLTGFGGVDLVSPSAVVTDTSTGGRQNRPCTMRDGAGAGTFAIVTGGTPLIGIEFDDGTVGWLLDAENITTIANETFAVDTAGADEFGDFIQLPAPMVIEGLSFVWNGSADTSDFEALVYSDPLGTPTVIASATIDATQAGSLTAGRFTVMLDTAVLLQKDTPYAITLRPTTTGTIGLRYVEYGDAKFNKMNGLGNNCYGVGRLDNTGAFTDESTIGVKTRVYLLSAMLRSFADDRTNASYQLGIY